MIWAKISRKVSCQRTHPPNDKATEFIAFEAPTFKLIGNSMVIGCLEVLAEAQTMAKKSGIGAEAAYDLVKGISISSRIPH
jgi:hypothetical protein